MLICDIFIIGEMMRRFREKGLTLIEVAIAIVLLAVSLCGSLSLFSYCNAFITRTRNTTIAVSEAYAVLEQIRASEYHQIMVDWHGETDVVADLSGGSFTVDVLDTDPGIPALPFLDPDLLWVTVTVDWQVKGGVNNLSLTTLIANRY